MLKGSPLEDKWRLHANTVSWGKAVYAPSLFCNRHWREAHMRIHVLHELFAIYIVQYIGLLWTGMTDQWQSVTVRLVIQSVVVMSVSQQEVHPSGFTS